MNFRFASCHISISSRNSSVSISQESPSPKFANSQLTVVRSFLISNTQAFPLTVQVFSLPDKTKSIDSRKNVSM